MSDSPHPQASAFSKGFDALIRGVQRILGIARSPKPGDVDVLIIDERSVSPGIRRQVTLRSPRDGTFRVYMLTPRCHSRALILNGREWTPSHADFVVFTGGLATFEVWHDRPVISPIVGYIAVPSIVV